MWSGPQYALKKPSKWTSGAKRLKGTGHDIRTGLKGYGLQGPGYEMARQQFIIKLFL